MVRRFRNRPPSPHGFWILWMGIGLPLLLGSCGTEPDQTRSGRSDVSEAGNFAREPAQGKHVLSLVRPGFRLYSPDEGRLGQLGRELEFIEKDLVPRLGVPPASQRLEVWDIHEPKVWNELLRQLEVRHAGIALQVENRIYVQPISDGEERYLALFHEWVHYAFWARGWRRLPLWAEEGVAQHYAWNTAQRYARSRGLELTRSQKPIAQDESFASNWRDLLKMKAYPKNLEEARDVYQCSEYLVRAILRQLRIDQHAALWKEWSERPQQLELILNQDFGWTPDDWKTMESNYQRFIQNSRS